MKTLTIDEFLTRIAGTDYLPAWANEGATELLAETPVPQPITTDKWCPFARVSTGTLREAHNRTYASVKKDDKSVYNLAGASCLTDRCQMWTGTDCGLKRSVP